MVLPERFTEMTSVARPCEGIVAAANNTARVEMIIFFIRPYFMNRYFKRKLKSGRSETLNID
jgi:hypothetical protein